MTKFFFKFKKPLFANPPNFLGKKSFSQNSRSVTNNFIRLSTIMSKLRESNDPDSKKTHSRIEGRARPFWLSPRSNKHNYSRLAFKSQRHRVQCWSNQK